MIDVLIKKGFEIAAKAVEGEGEGPIDEDKLDNCYKCDSETYPLCTGEKDNPLCKDCNVFSYI